MPALTLRDSAVTYMGPKRKQDKPVSRMIKYGPSALDTAELLAIMFGNNTAALVDAEHILSEFGHLPGIVQASFDELMRTPHFGPTRVAMMKAAFELGRRLLVSSPADRQRITDPAQAANMLMPEMMLLEQEHLRTVLLDARNRVLSIPIVYIGSVTQIGVEVRDIFREAIRANAVAMIVVHNHPSGDPTPSPNDVMTTRKMVDAGKMLDIDVLDHIIIGRNRWVSLKERGLGFN